MLGAFGAGVLLAALAVGLVAPNLAELEMQHGNHAAGVRTVLFLIAGCLIGVGVFVVLDRALSERGTFLRKTGNAILHFSRTARASSGDTAKHGVASFRSAPPGAYAPVQLSRSVSTIDG